jgi:hypothetical protein
LETISMGSTLPSQNRPLCSQIHAWLIKDCPLSHSISG